MGRATELGGALRLVERLEQNDSTAGAPQEPAARAARYHQLLLSIHRTLSSLEADSSPGGKIQVLAETVLESYSNVVKECIYRWEREIQMCHDLVCGGNTSIDAQRLEDIVLHRLHVRRRRLAECALFRAKGMEANNDMHFDSYFYANISFGVLEQRDALLDPNRLNYSPLGSNVDFAKVQHDLWQQYTPSEIRKLVRDEIVDSKGTDAEAIRSKLYDYLRAAMPEGFRPGNDHSIRQEAFLFEKCHDDTYRMTDVALNFLLCRMRIFKADDVVDLFKPANLPNDLVPGTRIRLHGLRARPELNGS